MGLWNSYPIAYNGFVFPVETEVVSVSSRPVPDRAGRAVAYSEFSLTLKFTIRPDALLGTTDVSMSSIRRLLSAFGGTLYFNWQGFGTFVINAPSAPPKDEEEGAGSGPGSGGEEEEEEIPVIRDVVWGPKPQVLEWKPIGSNRACEVTWRVQVGIPDHCADARTEFALMEANYTLAISLDQAGNTTRTYAGYLRIPQTRKSAGTKTLKDTADYYRLLINPPVPAGFQRNGSSFTVSEDKCTLDFSIIDVQLPIDHAPPPGILSVEGQHRVQNSTAQNFVKWTGTLSATYTLARGAARVVAYDHFMALIKARMEELKRSGKVTAILPMNFSATESLYGTTADFQFTYAATTSLFTILTNGLWSPIPSSDYKLWKASMEQLGVWNMRGTANLRITPEDDAIVDLCPNSMVGVLTNNGLGGKPPPGLPGTGGTGIIEDIGRQFPPNAATSWIDYVISLKFTEIPSTVAQQPLGKGGKTALVSSGIPGDNPLAATGAGFGTKEPKGQPAGTLVQHAPARYEAILSGYGIRYGFPVQAPGLKKLGKAKAVLANRSGDGVEQTTVYTMGPIPVHVTKWQLRYLLDRHPGDNYKEDLPKNPRQNNEGGRQA